MEDSMRNAFTLGIGALAVALSMMSSPAKSVDDPSKYPDLRGKWELIGSHRWEGPGREAPLTPEYRKIYEANLTAMANGYPGDMPSWYCLPQGMPMMMSLYDPMEIIITPDITYILISHVNDSYRRIYTDGRSWPAEGDYEDTFAGYSIGKWVDTDGDGKYDALEVETRHFKGPRVYDGSGLPLHHDNQSVITERIYLDKADKNVIVDDITVVDHALTRPWSHTRKARRDPTTRPFWQTAVCAEGNSMVRIGNEPYYTAPDGRLSPLNKTQPPPDLHYFNRPQN
jgi:hypothetical protein